MSEAIEVRTMVLRVLSENLRREVAAYIVERGPVSFADIINDRFFERNAGLLAYHVGVLKAAGLVTLEVSGSEGENSIYHATPLLKRVMAMNNVEFKEWVEG